MTKLLLAMIGVAVLARWMRGRVARRCQCRTRSRRRVRRCAEHPDLGRINPEGRLDQVDQWPVFVSSLRGRLGPSPSGSCAAAS